jgi:hypothetical protein
MDIVEGLERGLDCSPLVLSSMMESMQVWRQTHMILHCNIGTSTAFALSTVDCRGLHFVEKNGPKRVPKTDPKNERKRGPTTVVGPRLLPTLRSIFSPSLGSFASPQDRPTDKTAAQAAWLA